MLEYISSTRHRRLDKTLDQSLLRANEMLKARYQAHHSASHLHESLVVLGHGTLQLLVRPFLSHAERRGCELGLKNLIITTGARSPFYTIPDLPDQRLSNKTKIKSRIARINIRTGYRNTCQTRLIYSIGLNAWLLIDRSFVESINLTK